jgi:hypothetical protein
MSTLTLARQAEQGELDLKAKGRREAYTHALLMHLHHKLIREVPPEAAQVDEIWEQVDELGDEVVRLCGLYERGEVEKELLDKAAVGYLVRFRELATRLAPDPDQLALGVMA